jgi:acid stress chaperone HdeB
MWLARFPGATNCPKHEDLMTRNMAAAAIAALLFAAPASAETIDLATVKCSELGTMDEQGATFMFTWLLGYASGQAGTTTMDLTAMENTGTEIGEYCAKNPDVGLLSAATQVMSE